MTIRTPYEFEQDPETNPAGEKIISVADPIGSAAGASTYYLAKRFNFKEGDYTIAVTADDAATVWIGPTQLGSRIVATPTLAHPATANLHIPQGTYRIDVILQNLPPTPNDCFFTMIIKQGERTVYVSSAEGWLLDDAPIADVDLPATSDYRFDLPVFSILPNWKNGITERLSWLTDVIPSETDAEQRRSVRRNARRSFEAEFLRTLSQKTRLDTFFVGVGVAQFMVPIWHEQVKMNEGIDMEASGVTFPDGDFYLREFRKGDLVFVNDGDPDKYDILQVGDTEENRFSWAFPPPRAWPHGTRIWPMRVARMSQPPQMSNVTEATATVQALFDIVEPYYIPASWGGSVGSEPLFRFIPNRATPIGVEYGRKSFVLDNQSGAQAITDHGRYTHTTTRVDVRAKGRARVYAVRQFLQAARGRARHFQAPTFMADLVPLGDIVAGDQLLIRPQGFVQTMARPQPIRLRLSFQFKNESPTLYATILSATPIYKMNANGEAASPLQIVAEAFNLDTVLPNIDLRDLERISFLCETRFDQDTFELHHHNNADRDKHRVDLAFALRQTTNPRTAP